MESRTTQPAGEPFLCLVIPAYNEERRIFATLQEATSYLERQDYSWNILVADDGSTDGTAALVQEFARKEPRVLLRSLPHGGKGWAVRSGMLATKAAYRFLCDADLSMPIELIERFLPPKLTECNVALGSREVVGARRIGEPRRRHVMGRLFNAFTRLLAVRNVKDTQCGFKCFTGSAAEMLFSRQTLNGFGFDVEVLFLAQRMKLRLVEVPIDWYYKSESKVHPLRDGLAMGRDILKVRWNAWRGRYDGKAGALPG